MPERTKAPADRPKPRPPSMKAPAMRGNTKNNEAALKVTAAPIARPAVRRPKIIGPALLDAFSQRCIHETACMHADTFYSRGVSSDFRLPIVRFHAAKQFLQAAAPICEG